MNIETIETFLATHLLSFVLKLSIAIGVWIIGRWLIGVAVAMVTRMLTRQNVDPTLLRYIGNIVNVALNLMLVLAILGYLGLETTSFAALIAAMGLAIGLAWSGLLGNFAAGAFLIVLKPFKVGDFIGVGDIDGAVREIGLFATVLNTSQNVVVIVGNSKLLSENIRNYSANDHLRVDRKAQLAHNADAGEAIEQLKAALAAIPNVLTEPWPPVVEIGEFNAMGPVLTIRVFAPGQHFVQVGFDINRAIQDTLNPASYPVPGQYLHVFQTASTQNPEIAPMEGMNQ